MRKKLLATIIGSLGCSKHSNEVMLGAEVADPFWLWMKLHLGRNF